MPSANYSPIPQFQALQDLTLSRLNLRIILGDCDWITVRPEVIRSALAGKFRALDEISICLNNGIRNLRAWFAEVIEREEGLVAEG